MKEPHISHKFIRTTCKVMFATASLGQSGYFRSLGVSQALGLVDFTPPLDERMWGCIRSEQPREKIKGVLSTTLSGFLRATRRDRSPPFGQSSRRSELFKVPAKDCKSRFVCSECQKRHHKTIHDTERVRDQEEYGDLGHMRKIKVDGPGVAFYTPHHGVYRPENSTTKLRTVFNASSPSTSGKSLNSIQFNGGLVREDLFFIMVRFRKHKQCRFKIISGPDSRRSTGLLAPKFIARKPDQLIRALLSPNGPLGARPKHPIVTSGIPGFRGIQFEDHCCYLNQHAVGRRMDQQRRIPQHLRPGPFSRKEDSAPGR
ncbi:integrase catalytic domain-containing protein [Trichonephila clavipes]|nr:integrase catalytic domain-containing protein [Trichonephila clavipes]